MKNIESIKLRKNATIKEALEIIDGGSRQLALIVDENDKLIGTLSDGDIRRGLLKGFTLDNPIEQIIFTAPTIAEPGTTKEDLLRIALAKKLHQIPIVDGNGKVLDIKEIEELVEPAIKTNKVVLMAGGFGNRLRPLTQDVPKPMLKVGNKPILQTIVEKIAEYGYVNIIMCVKYKSRIIRDYFEDGSKFGVNIEYIVEEQRMGTAGALSLLKEKPDESFFVMNGDLLTNVNFEHLHHYHTLVDSVGTMCVKEYEFQVPYGVVNIADNKIVAIEEKPTRKFFVSAGIYMLSPEALEYIPKNKFFDMPELFEKLISLNKNIVSFPLREYWIDIGRLEEYERANAEYVKFFGCDK